MNVWFILFIYLYGYNAPPVEVTSYPTLARCEAAGIAWTKSSGYQRTKRAWACIPNR